jgi:alkanesulfonate monooxygenase SsuD/methylene tetrahydromethanopterin reductase-like flavin-dependent oxidoreductase (luciferase family)
MSVGVISHLDNPTTSDIVALAVAAEDAGARWLGIPDAFWWRDTWVLLASAARATSRLALGPLVTNPYLRHPFHTVAALATLQEIAGTRVFAGIGAGGSEITGAAHVSRRDAPARIESLVALIRSVAGDGVLDAPSGRRLEVPLTPVPIMVAGRGDGVLKAAGRVADGALLWAIPSSDLDRSISVVRAGAREHSPQLVWAPLVVHGESDRARVRVIAAYGIVNASPELRTRWGVDDALVADVRAALVGGGATAAAHLVPTHVVDDVADPDPSPARHGVVATRIGAQHLAVPAYTVADVAERVEWARAVLRAS